MRRASRRARSVVTLACLLVLAACAGDGDAGGASGAPDASVPAPEPDLAPALPVPDAAGGDRTVGGMWSQEQVDQDLELISRHEIAVDIASVVGTRALYDLIAEHSWPDGYTAETLVRCAFDDPAPTFEQLEDAGITFGLRFSDLEPRPDWRFPPTDERLADLGLRVYRSTRVELYRIDREVAWQRTVTAHVAVDPEGRVLSFPICTPFLPGAERHLPPVGGSFVGRPEVRLRLAHSLWDLTPMESMEACDMFRAIGEQEMLTSFRAVGWDLTLDELRAGFTSYCGWYWELEDSDGPPGV
jgi:hypothetical protein